ncbi:ATP-dependent helicase [Paraclostridium sordellii]|uniref:ATP-dependent helicase n=1 Tax=Paraclostridium sordellii TaxID=1505 RepID=UPI0012EE02A3|nr:ATP-dependent helicase [Paeniclostridium sordellii]
MVKLTREQEKIIQEEGSIVVNACPGSGKTYTITKKIIKIIEGLEDYQGVIAISYTNKASEELRRRCIESLNTGLRSSLFDTIHRFVYKEIILKFYKHIFHNGRKMLDIKKKTKYDKKFKDILFYENDTKKNNELYNLLYSCILDGIVPMNYLIEIGYYILINCKDCQKYIKSRYKYLFIDEYQDSTEYTHKLFLFINSLGIISIAVGDLNQSIFNKKVFLSELWSNDNFKKLELTINHRSHKSIIEYSKKLLDYRYEIQSKDKRVVHIHLDGNEKDIANSYESFIEEYKKVYNVKHNKNIAILVHSNRTAKIVSENINVNHKVYFSTKLDEHDSKWSRVFTKLLNFYFDNNFNSFDFSRQIFSEEYQLYNLDRLCCMLNKLIEIKENELKKNLVLFIEIAKYIEEGYDFDKKSVEYLNEVLNSEELLKSYGQPLNNEVQIMTLHKSKGLEFNIVFHMDLNAYAFPCENYNNPIDEYRMRRLHYVGLTRAKDAVILITSTKRTDKDYIQKDAFPSKYLYMNGLAKYRLQQDMTRKLSTITSNHYYYKKNRGNLDII